MNKETDRSATEELEELKERYESIEKRLGAVEALVSRPPIPNPIVGMHNVYGWCFNAPYPQLMMPRPFLQNNQEWINPFAPFNMFAKITYTTEIAISVKEEYASKHLFKFMGLMFRRDQNKKLIELNIEIDPRLGSPTCKFYSFTKEELEASPDHVDRDDKIFIRDCAYIIDIGLEQIDLLRGNLASIDPRAPHTHFNPSCEQMKEWIKSVIQSANDIASISSTNENKNDILDRFKDEESDFSVKELLTLKKTTYTSKEFNYPTDDMEKGPSGFAYRS